MTPEQQAGMRLKFNFKFDSLRETYPTWKIESPPPDATLDQIHDVYVKKIMISLNSSQWKVYLVIMFLGIEVFGIKVLGLDFRGYTLSQVRLMNRYDRLLIELGERYCLQGASQWSIETRFFMMAGINAVIFVIVKYLSTWLGGDDMAKQLQSVIDTLLNQESVFSAPPLQRDEHGLTVIPTEAAKAGPGVSSPPDVQPSFDLNSLIGTFGSMMGGASKGTGGFDVSSLVANLGSAFTRGMTPSGTTAGPTTKSEKGSVDASIARRAAERRKQAFLS